VLLFIHVIVLFFLFERVKLRFWKREANGVRRVAARLVGVSVGVRTVCGDRAAEM